MRKISVLTLIVFVIVAIGFWQYKSANSLQQEAKSKIKKTNDIKIEAKKTIDDKNKEIQETRQLSQLALAKKNHQQVYNSDPAIDAILLGDNFHKCINFLTDNEDEFGINSLKTMNVKSKTQLKFKQKQEQYCQKINTEHPEYLLSQKKQQSLLKNGLDKESEIGKILTGFYNKTEENLNDFDIAHKVSNLKNTDPNLLFKANRYFQSYINEYIYPQVSEVIGSYHQEYMMLVMSHAHNLYACRQGASCGEFSNLVAKLCIDDNLCGSNYDDILNNKISEGIRLDINIAYQMINDLYE